MLAIVVTYGTRGQQVYARGLENQADARRMRNTAVKLGYKDATIKHEKDLPPAQEAHGRSTPLPAKPYRRAG